MVRYRAVRAGKSLKELASLPRFERGTYSLGDLRPKPGRDGRKQEQMFPQPPLLVQIAIAGSANCRWFLVPDLDLLLGPPI